MIKSKKYRGVVYDDGGYYSLGDLTTKEEAQKIVDEYNKRFPKMSNRSRVVDDSFQI